MVSVGRKHKLHAEHCSRMQSGKRVVESAKDTAGNITASTKAGMEKTTASVEEKVVEKMRARDPEEKAEAARRKEERKYEAEAEKEAAKERHAAEREDVRAGGAAGGVVARYPAGQTPVASGGHAHAGGRGSTTGPVF
ncbi:unnamed protein product [Musa hybrid cultivar]